MPQDRHESSEDEPFVIVDDEPSEETESDGVVSEQEDELDGFRIRQMVQLRRSNIRSQTYAMVGMITMAVAAAKLAMLAYSSFVNEMWLFAAAYGTAALAAAVGSILFAINADRLRAEMKHGPQKSISAPNFDSLSDGSHHVRNLHEMHDDEQS